jgi:AcrR family transcriptional regulator
MVMDNKQIQEQRIKGYFIQATKEILKSEGLKSVSVRNIASQSGYSYATLYHYFKDVKELIFLCVKDFQNEISGTVEGKISGVEPGKERLKRIVSGYIGYFLEYPGIFELFYLERMSDISSNVETTQLIIGFLDQLGKEDWEIIEKNQAVRRLRKKEVNYCATGMLLFYLNRREPQSYNEFEERVREQLDFLLG